MTTTKLRQYRQPKDTMTKRQRLVAAAARAFDEAQERRDSQPRKRP